jgi:pimeloyl-ACP methyl ester carboxylesterase
LKSIGKQKIILFGHSTGSQDAIHYLLTSKVIQIDAAVLQAPLSDRQGQSIPADLLKEWLDLASKLISESKPNEMMPREAGKRTGGAPISAYRFWSLQAFNGDDDYFSSDLGQQREGEIWGGVAKTNIPILILQGSEDQYLPSFVNVKELTQSWARVFAEHGGKHGRFEIVNQGNHTLDNPNAQAHMWQLFRPLLELVSTSSNL